MRKLGWNDRDIPLDDAVCEISKDSDDNPYVRLVFALDGMMYEIEQDDLPDRVVTAFKAQA